MGKQTGYTSASASAKHTIDSCPYLVNLELKLQDDFAKKTRRTCQTPYQLLESFPLSTKKVTPWARAALELTQVRSTSLLVGGFRLAGAVQCCAQRLKWDAQVRPGMNIRFRISRCSRPFVSIPCAKQFCLTSVPSFAEARRRGSWVEMFLGFVIPFDFSASIV